jgi:hypothetical protein
MKMRKTTAALICAVFGFFAVVAAWFVLNHFRTQFYNSAMEGPSPEKSPYWTIIRAQEVLEWPIFVLAGLAGILILLEISRKIVSVFGR